MMADKKVTHVVKLQIQAGKANPAPPVGPALGPTGINIMQFCKDFNEKTAKDAGTIFPASPDRIYRKAHPSVFRRPVFQRGKLYYPGAAR